MYRSVDDEGSGEHSPREEQRKIVTHQPHSAEWSVGLFDCTEDCTTAALVCCCFPCYECYLYQRYDEFCCLPLCLPNAVMSLYSKHRHVKGIEGNLCNDCLVTTCCAPCALCRLGHDMDEKDLGR